MNSDNKKSTMIVGLVALVVIAGGIFWSMNNNDSDKKEDTSITKQEEKKVENIVGLASATPTLSTLVAGVKAAGLVETLQSAGPFTVFAPSNAAFDALPAGTLDTLLKPENVETLKGILTYHVVSGKVMAADLKDGQEVATVQGGKLVVSITDGKVYLTDAKGSKVMVETADIKAENGVVHLISGVLLPS